MRRVTVLASVIAVAAALLPAAAGGAAAAAQADVQRISGGPGTGRIATAISLSQAAFPEGGTDAVVVAFAGGFPDALAAAPLAAAAGGPVLLNDQDALNAGVRAEIQRLGASTAYVMGGESVQGQRVEDQLAEVVDTVRRVAGPDRMATAAEAATVAVQLWEADGHATAGDRVLVALGEHPDETKAWPDALASGALAGHARWPILLTRQGSVPDDTNQALRDLGTDHATVVGGPGAIPDSTKDQLDAATRDRIGGATRFATSTLLADEAVTRGAARTTVVAATGGNFPDGLAAGPTAYALGGVLVLVGGGDLVDSADTKAWFETHRGAIERVRVAGGPAAVVDEVLGQIGFALIDLVLGLQTVASGFSFPVYATSAPGESTIYVVERGGTIKRSDGSVFLQVGGVTAGGEQGLLGLAFHPDYAGNGRLFVHYTGSGGDTVVAEYNRAGGAPRTLLTVDQPASNHNGGQLEFGPDGYLYLGLGDGGGGNDQYGHGQDPDLLGSITRIDPDAAANQGAVNWMTGLRNPYRFSIDRTDGLIYIGDVGQGAREELDVVGWSAQGTNFGWPCREGSIAGPGGEGCPGSGFTDPVHDYQLHDGDGTCAVTGGVVYRGSVIPELRGQYLYGDYCAGWVKGFHVRHGQVTDHRDWIADAGSVTGFGTDADGEVLVVSGGGTVSRLVAAP